MNEKEQALLAFCQQEDEGITKYDIQKTEYDENTYDTPIGEFLILTDDEADKAMAESIKNYIEDMGVEGFDKDFVQEIYTECIDERSQDNLMEIIEEQYTLYMEDIKYETSDISDNLTRQQEEMIEFLSQEDTIDFNTSDVKTYFESKEQCDSAEKIEQFLETYEDEITDYIDQYAQQSAEEYEDNPIEYFQENFGNEEIKHLIEDGTINIDYEKVAEKIADSDGRGNELAGYDGEENEQKFNGETYYIYKQDDTERDKIEDIAQDYLDFTRLGEQIGVDDIITLLDTGEITREDIVNKDYDAVANCLEFDDDEIDITDD